jgi:glycosyltransferase involved in cell wall biosynthesis
LENALRVIGDRPSAVVFNAHEATHHPLRRAPTERFTLVYTGSVYWEQEWEILADALRQLRMNHPGYYRDLRVQLIGATSSHGPTMARIQRLIDAEPCVSAMTRMDRASTINAQSEADRLLHVGFKDKKGIVPLKFLEYIHAGVPVIQVSSTRDLQETIMEGTRTGIVAPDAATLLDVLLDGISGWRSGSPIRHDPDKAALEEYTWDHQMERWRQFILTVHRAHKGNGTATS